METVALANCEASSLRLGRSLFVLQLERVSSSRWAVHTLVSPFSTILRYPGCVLIRCMPMRYTHKMYAHETHARKAHVNEARPYETHP